MAAIHVLPEPEFFSTSQLKNWLGKGSALLKPMANDLRVAAEELRVVLAYTESTNPHLFGTDSKIRARLVAAHLRRAGEAVETADLSLLKTYLSFRRHYVDDMRGGRHGGRAPRRSFKFDE